MDEALIPSLIFLIKLCKSPYVSIEVESHRSPRTKLAEKFILRSYYSDGSHSEHEYPVINPTETGEHIVESQAIKDALVKALRDEELFTHRLGEFIHAGERHSDQKTEVGTVMTW